MIISATYTSIFDDSIRCDSSCKFETETKRVFDITTAENADDAEDANFLSDEFVTLEDNILRASNGVVFDY